MSIKIERYLMHCKDCNNKFWALKDMKNNLPDDCIYCGAKNSRNPNIEPHTIDFISLDSDLYEIDIDQETGIPFMKHHEQILRSAEILANLSQNYGQVIDGFRVRECIIAIREELRNLNGKSENIIAGEK
ncbi:hypothetical protein PUW25_25840 (plasmid) [Paenibacillus urinalis]|uniref:Zinc ribbon domain-containing protein n=1 Tax=Paenibacillus urinalis TaxID=521520 RepID=A0ABY7XKE1_9BACL|nr:hypothetical protein [Paenibacillus urinalis]WDI05234.1 hypothetical protein PUW25_25840 [Paenibacillus urinalis]